MASSTSPSKGLFAHRWARQLGIIVLVAGTGGLISAALSRGSPDYIQHAFKAVMVVTAWILARRVGRSAI
jgi:hypothetical protein